MTGTGGRGNSGPADGLAVRLAAAGICGGEKACRQLLAAIDRLGYRLVPQRPGKEGGGDDAWMDGYPALQKRLEEELAAPSIGRLHGCYLQRDHRLWRRHPDLFLRVGNAILELGEPLLAYDVFSSGLEALGHPLPLDRDRGKERDIAVALVRGQAKALTQSGAHSQARDLLEMLVQHDVSDSETMGLLGRIYKDMAFSDPDRQQEYLDRGFGIYYSAYRKARAENDLDGAYYNGINAATLAFFNEDRERSLELAREVEALCLQVRARGKEGADSFWLDATLAEAILLQGEPERAWELYRKACARAGGNLLSLSSIIRQARRIQEHANIRVTIAPGPCSLPSVMVFSGHMIDGRDRAVPRFPASREKEVKARIGLEIDRLKGKIGYSAAAAGGDILFLEAMAARGGEIHIVLPVGIDDFKAQSVSPAGPEWERRFDAILDRADSLTVLDEFNPRNFENSLEFANTYLFGIGLIRAEQIGSRLHPLAVVDPVSPGGRGGTASMIRLWQRRKVEYALITLSASGGKTGRAPTSDSSLAKQPPPTLASPPCTCVDKVRHHAYLPMLFADVKGYSRLSENEAICFSGTFLSRMAQVLQRYQAAILSKRTVGDGLFLVFYGLEPAIQVARDLQRMITTHDWRQDGLPADLQMRISLDAGPCYSYIDPVMDKLEFCGNYVVRAARLEPITPPGHIYASDTFVALSRAEGLGRGGFSYAGTVILPKGYGTLAVYHVNLL